MICPVCSTKMSIFRMIFKVSNWKCFKCYQCETFIGQKWQNLLLVWISTTFFLVVARYGLSMLGVVSGVFITTVLFVFCLIFCECILGRIDRVEQKSR